jgi:hypothetical protein
VYAFLAHQTVATPYLREVKTGTVSWWMRGEEISEAYFRDYKTWLRIRCRRKYYRATIIQHKCERLKTYRVQESRLVRFEERARCKRVVSGVGLGGAFARDFGTCREVKTKEEL